MNKVIRKLSKSIGNKSINCEHDESEQMKILVSSAREEFECAEVGCKNFKWCKQLKIKRRMVKNEILKDA